MGVTLALPLLDSMVPAGTPLVRTAALPKSRFCGIYIPHGATMDKWTPATEGSGFAFTETLKPLEKLRDRLTVVSNLAHPLAGGKGSDAGADHARSAAVFLSGAHPQKGIVHGGKTHRPGAGRAHRAGHAAAVDRGRASRKWRSTAAPATAARTTTPSRGRTTRCRCRWRTARRSCSSGCSATAPTRRSGCRASSRTSSILDSVTDKVSRLQSGLDAGDRARLGEYLDNVREIERRIQKADAAVGRTTPTCPRRRSACPRRSRITSS